MTYHLKLAKITFRMGDFMKFTKKSTFIFRIILIVLTLLLIVFIFSNSLKTAEVSSVSSGRVVDFLNSICVSLKLKFTFTQQIVRPLAHFCEFGLLGVLSSLTAISYFTVKAKSMIISLISFSFIAFIDECIQLFSDGRAFQVSDMLIDFAGGLIGSVTVFLISLIVYNHKIKGLEKEM